MAKEGFKRKLAAILSADVEGYSRLMDDDEEATIHTLTSYRATMSEFIEQYRGRQLVSRIQRHRQPIRRGGISPELQREWEESLEHSPRRSRRNRHRTDRVGTADAQAGD